MVTNSRQDNSESGWGKSWWDDSSQELSTQSVGHSAYTKDLDADSEIPGWDQLSWDDMDVSRPGGGKVVGSRSNTPTSWLAQLLREWGPVVLIAVAIALCVRLWIMQAYHIPSGSMIPTLQTGDRVMVNMLSYRFSDIERGDVVVFKKPPTQIGGENDLIKRVIGLPGDVIRFEDGQVYINEYLVEEPYLAVPNSSRVSGLIPGCVQTNPTPGQCEVPEGFLFVLGDNRNGSSDSRIFGPVAVDGVVGRAFAKVWPPNHIGPL